MSIQPLTHQANKLSKPFPIKISIGLAIIALLVTLVMVNLNIKKFETHLNTGKPVLLELAPIDPRGLMQGDYMALRFELADDIKAALQTHYDEQDIANSDGIAIVKLDEHQVAHFVRLASFSGLEHLNIDSNTDNRTNPLASNALAPDEMPLYFRIRNNQVKFATNAFFFQEGHAKDYEAAEYGLFRVNQQGEPLLTDMVNAEFEVIEGGTASNDTGNDANDDANLRKVLPLK